MQEDKMQTQEVDKLLDGDFRYKSFTVNNFGKIPQVIEHLTPEEIEEIKIVSSVLPFKANNYVVDELINWHNFRNDPIFNLTFPNKQMLKSRHYKLISDLYKRSAGKEQIEDAAIKIRHELNPHPAGQSKYNVPLHKGKPVEGIQHKYDHTVLFFPRQGQTCHAYCTFCFRWPQFVKTKDLKFATKDIDNVLEYIRNHNDISDILFTGGDPMVMAGKVIDQYITKIINAKIPHLKNIRFGSKSLAYWPYTFTNKNGEIILGAFKKLIDNGYHVALMAHFNHYKELNTVAVKKSIELIRSCGVVIRAQSPVIRNINDNYEIWAKMWTKEVELGIIPYYMFIIRDTGAQHYFNISLIKAWEIFRDAYQNVTGLARTVRGPSMSCEPGKIHILGVSEIKGEKVIVLRFLQGRNSDWIHKPFFAKYNPNASWIDELEPAFDEERFFYQDELEEIYDIKEMKYLKIEQISKN